MVAMATSLRKEGRRLRLRRGAGRPGRRMSACGEQECVGEFEGDGCAAEGFEGVGAACLGGIDDGEGFGDAQGVVGEMVVGDDEVEAEELRFVGCGKGADAGVDADDEADACGGGLSEDAGLHAVAFADAMRDVIGDDGGSVFRRDAFDGGFEEDGGGGAVYVVVAVDEDGFAGRGRPAGFWQRRGPCRA